MKEKKKNKKSISRNENIDINSINQLRKEIMDTTDFEDVNAYEELKMDLNINSVSNKKILNINDMKGNSFGIKSYDLLNKKNNNSSNFTNDNLETNDKTKKLRFLKNRDKNSSYELSDEIKKKVKRDVFSYDNKEGSILKKKSTYSNIKKGNYSNEENIIKELFYDNILETELIRGYFNGQPNRNLIIPLQSSLECYKDTFIREKEDKVNLSILDFGDPNLSIFGVKQEDFDIECIYLSYYDSLIQDYYDNNIRNNEKNEQKLISFNEFNLAIKNSNKKRRLSNILNAASCVLSDIDKKFLEQNISENQSDIISYLSTEMLIELSILMLQKKSTIFSKYRETYLEFYNDNQMLLDNYYNNAELLYSDMDNTLVSCMDNQKITISILLASHEDVVKKYLKNCLQYIDYKPKNEKNQKNNKQCKKEQNINKNKGKDKNDSDNIFNAREKYTEEMNKKMVGVISKFPLIYNKLCKMKTKKDIKDIKELEILLPLCARSGNKENQTILKLSNKKERANAINEIVEMSLEINMFKIYALKEMNTSLSIELNLNTYETYLTSFLVQLFNDILTPINYCYAVYTMYSSIVYSKIKKIENEDIIDSKLFNNDNNKNLFKQHYINHLSDIIKDININNNSITNLTELKNGYEREKKNFNSFFHYNHNENELIELLTNEVKNKNELPYNYLIKYKFDTQQYNEEISKDLLKSLRFFIDYIAASYTTLEIKKEKEDENENSNIQIDTTITEDNDDTEIINDIHDCNLSEFTNEELEENSTDEIEKEIIYISEQNIVNIDSLTINDIKEDVNNGNLYKGFKHSVFEDLFSIKDILYKCNNIFELFDAMNSHNHPYMSFVEGLFKYSGYDISSLINLSDFDYKAFTRAFEKMLGFYKNHNDYSILMDSYNITLAFGFIIMCLLQNDKYSKTVKKDNNEYMQEQTINHYIEENKELRKNCEDFENKYNNSLSKLRENNKKHQDEINRIKELEEKKVKKEYHTEISNYKKEIEELKKQVESLSKENAILKNNIYELRNNSESIDFINSDLDDNEDDLDLFNTPESTMNKLRELSEKYHIEFVGGHEKLKRKIASIYPSIHLCSSTPNKSDVDYTKNADIIFFYTKHMSHSLYIKISNLCDCWTVPFSYINVTNMDLISKAIIEDITKILES